MLDFIIRNQAIFWLSVGIIATLFVFLEGSTLFGRFASPTVPTAVPVEPVAKGLVIPHKWLLVVGAVILLFSGIFAFSPPIPKTTALDLPPPIRETPNNPYLILFVHGWRGDAAETWRDFPNLVMKDPRFEKCDIISLSYPTYIMRRSLSIPELSHWLTEELRLKNYYTRYTKVCVVAHSMGGVVAREIVIENRLSGLPNSITKLVEIATPHLGARIADLAEAIGIDRAYIKDIQTGAKFLEDLDEHWNALKPRPATFAITSVGDAIVTLQSAKWQCDRYQVFPKWSHTELAKPESLQDDRYMFAMDEVCTAFE